MNTSNLFDFEIFPQLETERLLLRAIRSEDAEAVFRIFSDDEVTRYYDMETFSSLEQARQLTMGMIERFQNKVRIRWGITLKGEDVVIGTCGYPVWEKFRFAGGIGYDLAREYWHRGITSEAVTAMLQFGFERMGLNRVEAVVMSGNVHSMQLLRGLAFEEEGILREWGFWKGRFQDVKLFSLLRRDFGKVE